MLSGIRRVFGLSDRVRPLSSEEVFTLLSNHRRHYVISSLPEKRSVPFNELVDWIAALERERSDEADSSDRRAAVYTSLYQTHIPKLAKADLVVHNHERKEVRITERGLWLRSYLRAARGDGVPWDRVFLAESLFWTVVALAALGNVPPVRTLPMSWIVIGCVGTFLVTSFSYGRQLSKRGYRF